MDEDASTGTLFSDPPDYYPPSPPPKTETYTLRTGQVLTLHLVGHSPLEAHHLWNGARVVSSLFEDDPSMVRDKTVLELGAGAGLPSLVCGVLGCRRAVVTDFPDADLVGNLWRNVEGMEEVFEGDGGGGGGCVKGRVRAAGFVWGGDISPLLQELTTSSSQPSIPTPTLTPTPTPTQTPSPPPPQGFDILILADLLFRHSEHAKLVKTIQEALKLHRDSRAYVVFTSYRPWLRHKDLAFFDVCREKGLVVEQILERRLERPLFEDDPGDVEVQKTVTGWVVRWPEEMFG